jgi:hypothetical protein
MGSRVDVDNDDDFKRDINLLNSVNLFGNRPDIAVKILLHVIKQNIPVFTVCKYWVRISTQKRLSWFIDHFLVRPLQLIHNHLVAQRHVIQGFDKM